MSLQLPTLDVYIAFNPLEGGNTLTTANTVALPASGSSNAYWTNVSSRVLDFTTQEGKQHFLDRVEASTLQMTVTNRDGYFLNGTTNGSGYVIQARQPIAVTETWSGTTHPIFWGLTDDVEEKITDQVNVDLTINASDLLKQLSLKYMVSKNFYSTYANSTSAINWYRCGGMAQAVITSASSNGTTVTYIGANTFTAGQYCTISGLGVSTGVSLNLANVQVASIITSGGQQTGFTVTNSVTTSTSSGTGTAIATLVTDSIGSSNGALKGPVAFQSYGALIYDTNTCVDLTNGTNTPTGYLNIPSKTSLIGGIDLWILGQGIAATTICGTLYGTSTVPTVYQIFLDVTGNGYLAVTLSPLGGGDTTIVSNGLPVNDGFWHHVGLILNTSGYLELYQDGMVTSLGVNIPGFNNMNVSVTEPFNIGASSGEIADCGAYIQDIVLSSTASPSTLTNEVFSRYRAGSLLQWANQWSGDRIAEILCLAGYGSIVNGVIVLHTNTFYISNTYQTPVAWAWSTGSSPQINTNTNGAFYVEPYYWDSPTIGSTALDLIYQITDTDIGPFFQSTNGALHFYTQTYFNSYTSPSGDHVWGDNGTGVPYDGPSLQMVRDDADVWTSVKVTPQSGVDQIYENTAAEPRWGSSTLIKSSTLHISLAAALNTATYLGGLFAQPLPRVGNVELRAETANGADMTALFVPASDVVQFIRTAPNASTSGSYPSVQGLVNTNMVVESKSFDFQADPGQLHVSYVLSPYELV